MRHSIMPECPPLPVLPWHPHVGVAIGVLAALGVAVPWIFDKLGRDKRAVMSLIFFLFVGIEYWAIREDQIQHDNEQALARCEQLKSFEAIGSKIEKAIRENKEQFSIEIGKLNQNLQQEERTFDQTRPKADVEFLAIDPLPWVALMNGAPFHANVHFVNKGTIPAKNISKLVKLIVESPDEKGQTRALEQFERAWPLERKAAGAILAEGDEHFQTFDQTKLNQINFVDFRQGKLTIYIIFRAEYEDPNGKWGSDYCEAFQTPFRPGIDTVTYTCRPYSGKSPNKPQYKIGRK